MEKEALTIRQCEEIPRLRVSLLDIDTIKRQHVLENLCYSPKDAGAIFGKSEKWALERVKDGKLVAVDENAKTGRDKRLHLSQGVRITALSISAFRREYEIAPERWAE